MPSTSRSQQRLFAQVHALQKGSLSPESVSPKIRDIAAHISKTDARHFAETKHKGLPEKVAGRHGFLAMVRNTAGGGQSLDSASPSVSAAAKRYEPKDSRSVPVENGVTSQAALTKMSSTTLLTAAYHLCKQADVHSIIAKTHRAISQAGAKNRDLLRKELDQVKAENAKLQGTADQASAKIMQAETKAQGAAQKQQEAEMNAAMASKSIEQLQMAQMAQRTPPPPEQPAYGQMLMGGQQGGGMGAGTPAPQQASPAPMPGQV